MTGIIWFIQILNTLSPLGLASLLAVIIYLQVKGKQQVATISDNHLSGLPEIAEALRRIELKLGEEFSFIRAKLNGK